MAAETLAEVLYHVRINSVISRLLGPAYPILQLYGMLPGGVSEEPIGGREFGWDVFDANREIAEFRGDDAGPNNVTPNPVGQVLASFSRIYETITLKQSMIAFNRMLGGSLGTIDPRGERLVTEQANYLARRNLQCRELMLLETFKGGYGQIVQGDSILPVPKGTANAKEVTVRHPATHQGAVPNLDGTSNVFAGDWQDEANAKIGTEMINLQKHAQQHSRFPISIGLITAKILGYMMENAQLRAMAGSANTPFTLFQLDPQFQSNPEGIQAPIQVARFAAIPNVTFYAFDGFYRMFDGTSFVNREAIPNGKAIFTPAPSPLWLTLAQGSEFISRTDPVNEQSLEEATGLTFWEKLLNDPPRMVLHSVDNFLVTPKNPNAYYYATVHA